MSAYFDAKQTELLELAEDKFEDFERRIIQDVANVGELLRAEGGTTAFPENLRDAAYQALMRFSPAAWPCGLKYGGPDYEDVAAHRYGISRMLEVLHDLLHEAARRGWEGGDGIRHPILVASTRMEERCEQLALAAGAERASWAVEAEKQLTEERSQQSPSSSTTRP